MRSMTQTVIKRFLSNFVGKPEYSRSFGPISLFLNNIFMLENTNNVIVSIEQCHAFDRHFNDYFFQSLRMFSD